MRNVAHVVELRLGETASELVIDAGSPGETVLTFALGIDQLTRRHFATPMPTAAAVELAIAEVEDHVMPLRRMLPDASRLVTADHRVRAVADQLAPDGSTLDVLDIDAVEALFNRWVAIALGRRALHDSLPPSGEFAATLLVLREILHHLGWGEIALQAPPHPPRGCPASPP